VAHILIIGDTPIKARKNTI